jgi:demethylmenaquinone methyltransferase/2-methoxy-6-polyprenyl-1,4-benzoquinol methylase
MTRKTHFGFKTVEEDAKAPLVRDVFDKVASRYDLMNDCMSMGMHHQWKDDFISWLAPRDGMQIVDVAGGTGDIAFRMLDSADCHVTLCDINQSMLMEGKRRAMDAGRLQGLEWTCADAQKLPLKSNSMDAYTIAFGIRNVTRIDEALKEAYRVLKPGARFMCLEFSRPTADWFRKVYDSYSFSVIPKMGELLTGDADPYQYLVESIRQFPDQEKFVEMIREAGFINVQYRNMTQGVVAIHSGRKF